MRHKRACGNTDITTSKMEPPKTLWDIPKTFWAAAPNLWDTPTPANHLARNETQAAAVREVRGFVNQFLRFPPVTNVDRVEMGIPNHDTIRTDHVVVNETADFVIHLRNIRELVVEFWQSGAKHHAKPHGYDGAILVWDIQGIGADAIAGTNRSFDTVAADIASAGEISLTSNATGSTNPSQPDTFIHHTMASRTPFTLHFEEADRGKTVYIALAWQNERGITGAWSEIKSAIIP